MTSTFLRVVTFIIEKEGNQNPQGCMGFEGQQELLAGAKHLAMVSSSNFPIQKNKRWFQHTHHCINVER